ncbi:hypothetical protein AR687_02755 [Flavobacteriaceae bacterium CRH]|nr:hypothetical protein AR687_02755 [Flavobacteriaceae bacterium CRH]
MIIEFENSLEDYSKSSREILKKYFFNTILASAGIASIITFFTVSIIGLNFDWLETCLIFLVSTIIITFLYNLKTAYNGYTIRKIVSKNSLFLGKKIIITDEDGLNYGSQNKKYEWSSIKKMDNLPNYIYLILHNNTSILINKKGLQNSEINNFVRELSDNIIVKKTFLEKITSKKLYKLGFLGFIPNFGLLAGIVLIFEGFIRKDNKMKLIGLAGIFFTPLFWYFFLNSDFHERHLIQFTDHRLNEVVKDLEFYKSKKGQYPDSLGQLKSKNKFFFDEEFFSDEFDFKKSKPARFYYKKTDKDYVLKSFGPDLILDTKDDIYPEL